LPPVNEQRYCDAGRHAVTLCVLCISLGGEGNVLYPVFSSWVFVCLYVSVYEAAMCLLCACVCMSVRVLVSVRVCVCVCVVEWIERSEWSVDMAKSYWTQPADITGVIHWWSCSTRLIHAVSSCQSAAAAAALSAFVSLTAATHCRSSHYQVLWCKSVTAFGFLLSAELLYFDANCWSKLCALQQILLSHEHADQVVWHAHCWLKWMCCITDSGVMWRCFSSVLTVC